MEIVVGILAVVLNRAFCSLLLYIEKRLATKGKIPPKGQVLYLKDYNFFRWGDLILVTILDFCVAVVLLTGHLSWIAIWVVVILGTVWTWYCHSKLWLPRKQGFDSCYPREGQVSSLGRVHLIYFWLQWTLGPLAFWEVMQMAPRAVGLSFGRPLDWYTSPIALLGLAAAGAYFRILRLDAKAGRFPYPLIKKEVNKEG